MIEHVNVAIERKARQTGLSPEPVMNPRNMRLQNPAALAGVFQAIEQPPDGGFEFVVFRRRHYSVIGNAFRERMGLQYGLIAPSSTQLPVSPFLGGQKEGMMRRVSIFSAIQTMGSGVA